MNAKKTQKPHFNSAVLKQASKLPQLLKMPFLFAQSQMKPTLQNKTQRFPRFADDTVIPF